jgi:hypothetical protein
MDKTKDRYFLIAEYCDASFYMGWHLYLRDNQEVQKRNHDGTWGWLRCVHRQGKNPVQHIFDELEIEIKGDGTCDYDGIAEMARRFPMPKKQTVGGRQRGCVEVDVDRYGRIALHVPLDK